MGRLTLWRRIMIWLRPIRQAVQRVLYPIKQRVPVDLILGGGFILFMAFILSGAVVGSDIPSEPEQVDSDEIAAEIHDKINDERIASGVGRLRSEDRISAAAESHSEWMAENDNLTHVTPDGQTHTDRLSDHGIGCTYSSENVAMNYIGVTVYTDNQTEYYTNETAVAQGIVNQWMNSKGHRENILDSTFSAVGTGVGVTENTDEDIVIYATQNFCA